MAIEAVLYKNGSVHEEISLEDIENRSDYDVIRKNLYCVYDGCESRIEYVPKGKRIAHFKTWPNSNHSTDCIDYFLRVEKNKSQKSLATSSMGLTDKHINNVLKSLIKSVDETEEEKAVRLESQRAKRKKKKNNIVDITQNPDEVMNVRPTTDKDADIVGEGKRSPSVKKRHSISFLSDDDVGTATGLHEYIKSITIEDRRVIITLKKNQKQTNVYFEEAFFVNSAMNVDNMFKIVEKAILNGDKVRLYCVGNVQIRNDELCLVINAQSHIRVNKMRIERFAFTYSNPNLL